MCENIRMRLQLTTAQALRIQQHRGDVETGAELGLIFCMVNGVTRDVGNAS